MSFLVASGHVQVDANTRGAKDEIQNLIRAMGGLGPSATAAANAVKDLGKRADLSARAVGRLGERAQDAERSLARLRAVAGDIRITAQLDDDTNAGAASVRATIRALRSEGPVRISATFDGDPAQILASAQAMRDLRDNARSAGQTLTVLTAQSAAAAAALNALQDAAQDASRALRTLRGRAAATAEAMRELRDTTARASTALNTFANRANTTDGRLTSLSGNARTLRSDMDDLDTSLRRVGGSMGALRPRIGGLGSGSGNSANGMQDLLKVALLLSPALIPIAASLTAVAVSAAAAGVGVGAFGVAVGAQIKAMAEGAEAQGKYDKAVKEHGERSAEAIKAQAELAATYKDMPRATQEAAAALSVLKDEYTDWSDALAADTMPVVTKSMALFGAMLPRLTPMVQGASTQLERLINVAAGGVVSPGFDAFMDKFAQFSAGAIGKATDGLVRFSMALDSGAVSSDVAEFMDYARANGPLVGETLRNLATALTHLVVATSDVGVSMLTVVNALAGLVNAVPTGAISTFIQMYAAMKLIKLGIAGITAVTGSGAAASLSAFMHSAAFGGLSAATSGFVASMTAMQKGVAIAAAAFAAFYVGQKIGEAFWSKTPTSAEHVAAAFAKMGEAGRMAAPDLSTLSDSADRLKNASIADTIYDYGTFHSNQEWKKASGDFEAWDEQLSKLVASGDMKTAKNSFDQITAALRKQGLSGKEIADLFPHYKESLASAKQEAKLAADGMGLFGQQAMATKTKLDAQKASADGLRASIQALNDVNRAALGGMIGFEASIDAAAKAAKENAGSLRMVNGELDLNSPKAQAAATALTDLGAKTDAATAAARESGASWEKINGIYSRGRSELIKYAQQMGLSRSEAKTFADSVLQIPDKKDVRVDMRTEDAVRGLNSVIAKLKATPGAKSVTVKALTHDAVAALESMGFTVKRLPDGRFKVTADTGSAKANLAAVRAARDAIKSKSFDITARDRASAAARAIKAAIDKIRGKSVTITTVHRSLGVEGTAGRNARNYGAAGGLASRLPSKTFPGYADGSIAGAVLEGPGTKTSDSLLARLSRGEWVMRAAAVDKYGPSFMAAVNEGRLSLPGFAKGSRLSEKQKAAIEAEKARQKEGRSALTGDVTFTTGGRLAGYQHTEAVHDLGMPDSVSSLVSSINSYLSNIKKAFSGSTEKNLVAKMTSSGKALLDNQKKLEAVNKSLDSAKSNLEELKGKFDSLKTSVSSSLVSFANITKIGKYGTSTDTLIKQLSNDVGRTTEFSKQLEQLKAMGLNGQSISEIAQAGVTGGGMATAQSLLNATPEQIAQINALEKQLQLSADKAGTTTADAMYGAGVRAAEGIVKGLTAQQDKIEAAMMKIAESMEKAIKKALGIKSPAKRLEPIGDYSFRGVEQGWIKRMAKGNTLISGSAAGLRIKPSVTAGGAAAPSGAPVMVQLNPTFNTMTLPAPAERKAFAVAMAKDINDALLAYQKERRR